MPVRLLSRLDPVWEANNEEVDSYTVVTPDSHYVKDVKSDVGCLLLRFSL